MANILLIDDDQSLLQMMGLIIQRIGHKSLMTTSPKEGVAMAKQHQPDMVIIDLMMPEISGFEVCRMLREDSETKDIPLLILTAVSQDESRELAIQSGADGFLTKPITKEALERHIETLLETGAQNMLVPKETAPPPRPSSGAASKSKTVYNFTRESGMPEAKADSAPLAIAGVMGLSTGVGATTVAVNLALGAMQFGRSCLLDLQDYGNVAVQLRLTPTSKTWADLLELRPGDDKKRIGQTLLLNHSSGVAVMASPNRRMDQRMDNGGLLYMLRVLNEGFNRLIVLLPTIPTPMSETVMKVANNLVVVVGDDPAAISAAQNALSEIERMNLKATQHIILNRTHPHGMGFEEVSTALDRPLQASIPYDENQLQALSAGHPMLMLAPNSLYARSIIQLSRQL